MPEWFSGALYLIVIITVLVVAHEWGHFIAARRFGMRVDEFSIFFGPVLWRVGQRGDTVYNVRTFPVGGFVKIAGMEADDISGGRPILEAIRHEADDPAVSMEQILEQLESDTMAGISVANITDHVRDITRSAIAPDGRLTEQGAADLRHALLSPQVNDDETRLIQLLLNADDHAGDAGLYSRKPLYQRAIVIFAGPFMSILFAYLLFCSLGMTVGLPTGQLTNRLQEVKPGGPAARAGLRLGDRILSVNGAATPDGKSMVMAIRSRPAQPILLTIQRGRDQFLVRVTSYAVQDETVKDAKRMVGRIEVVPDDVLRRKGFVDSLSDGTRMTGIYVTQLVRVLFVEGRVKESLGGPIAMGQMTIAQQRLGFARVVMMAAPLSLSLGILNLLPIPILDGGHLLLLAIEKARRRRLTAREMYRAQVIGLGILAMLIVFVMFNDISRTLSGRSVQ